MPKPGRAVHGTSRVSGEARCLMAPGQCGAVPRAIDAVGTAIGRRSHRERSPAAPDDRVSSTGLPGIGTSPAEVVMGTSAIERFVPGLTMVRTYRVRLLGKDVTAGL